MKSILNIEISCFENCNSTIPKTVNLLSWLTNEKHRAKVENLRSIQDEKLQKSIKLSLPAITPSGLFSYRAEKDLIAHSGFLAFDIDKKDNLHITNFDELREQISHITAVAYCGLSVRGKGYWGLIPIPKSTPEEHRYRFAALSKFFKEYGINLDPSGKDVCRLRIYSVDNEAYFNHNATLYTRTLKPVRRTSNTRPAFSDTREKVEAVISLLNGRDITGVYEEWVKLASAFANEFGESGRGYFHAISKYHPDYNDSKTSRLFDACLKHDYNKVSIGSFFHVAESYGIKLTPETLIAHPKPNIQQNAANSQPSDPVFKCGAWDEDILYLEKFFKVIPSEPVRLSKCEMITDPDLFIKSHLEMVKAQNGKTRYVPYLDRLKKLKIFLS